MAQVDDGSICAGDARRVRHASTRDSMPVWDSNININVALSFFDCLHYMTGRTCIHDGILRDRLP